ncbi:MULTISPECIES: P1 family peptidase [Bacillaceae]|uniref:P1 family peptidase n=1 Tax=Evansella alkalicola TaxID=745819 RepID=A0ABS6JXV3_9BACI|nr:P1 family peptidase [Litchfieldia alkalitelluris]MBU9721935.1 P1 family peptidase [Bacillus alkalicola]
MSDKLKRARKRGIVIGSLPTGERNKITDVHGVSVGHMTVQQGDINTGVTAILPHQGNVFIEKVIAASHVLNGFGKTMGTIQINELGTIETPILMTNTLSVGSGANGLIKYTLKNNPEIGRTTGTVNPIVTECNDMYLNDIRSMAITEEDVFTAIANAQLDFEEGAVGAGTGMKCFGLKGGIGSASRLIDIEGEGFTFGVLVLSNFGHLNDLVINGKKVGRSIAELELDITTEKDKGSIIVIVATDMPVTSRQLERIIKRCGVGLSRTGSKMGHNSGDIVIGFSTGNKVFHQPSSKKHQLTYFHEDEIDNAFQAVAEATEEAIINSMLTAKTTVGRDGNTLYSLTEYIDKIK